jgi:Holliday junction resolvase RusA-like endonuclease
MEFEFIIPGKAFSVNAYYYAIRKVKTSEARAWEELVAQELEELKELTDMAMDFNEKGGTLAIWIDVQYPHHVYYNNLGLVSSKTFDCSNVEKPLLDLIVGRRMGINDKFVTELHSTKSVGSTYQIVVKIQHLL